MFNRRVYFFERPEDNGLMPRIYLAGPDVFRLDAASHYQRLAAICETLGLEALVPFDESVTPKTTPHSIYAANMKLLRAAHGVVANLAPFRGVEPDSGTVFEVGAAIALGLPVVAYGVPPGAYSDRVDARRDGEGVLRDQAGFEVEDFGLPMNLMLSRAVEFADTAEGALNLMASRLGEKR